jgi:hypothetical protein
MNHVDEMLSSLRAAPLPPALEAIDGPVLAGMALGRERRAGRRSLALACGVAAVVGLWGGLAVPTQDAGHTRDHSLLAIPASAPSHLLQA